MGRVADPMDRIPLHEYDDIGCGYALRRRPDPRLARRFAEALGDTSSVVNVGAGSGSYEPMGRPVVAVEPSMVMIRQRPQGAAPVVRACAEALPFPDASFGAGLAVLTIHHWHDWRAGLLELLRVTRGRVVLFTWDPQSAGSWVVRDYFPELLEADRRRFPGIDALREVLGRFEVVPVPIPGDCTDGFLGAYWRRPASYLDPDVRSGISAFAGGTSEVALDRLADDLESGEWARRHGAVLDAQELDLGYRLVVARLNSA